jgi:hypothetical protein
MDGLSGIGSIPGYGMMPQVYGTAAAGTAPAAPAQGGEIGTIAGGALSASQSVLSLSSTSITANVESFMGTYGPVMSSNEMLGAVLLMLIMEYLKTDNDQDKKDLLGLISTLAQQQQGAGGGGSFIYQSSSLSIESTQLQVASSEMNFGAYSGAAATLQQAPAADPGSAGLDVVA